MPEVDHVLGLVYNGAGQSQYVTVEVVVLVVIFLLAAGLIVRRIVNARSWRRTLSERGSTTDQTTTDRDNLI
jgi:hypothetical protein